MKQQTLICNLPNGQQLVARMYEDIEYPSIDIYLEGEGFESQKICFAEYNPDCRDSAEDVFVGAYVPNQEDVEYYESYNIRELD